MTLLEVRSQTAASTSFATIPISTLAMDQEKGVRELV